MTARILSRRTPMHPEHVEAVTRRRFDQWTCKLDQNGATPGVGIGVRQ